MREVTIDGATLKIEPFDQLPAHPLGRGRSKSPVRKVCESLRDGESVFLPVPSKIVERQNLWALGKAIGATFRYRTEGEGVRIYRIASEARTKAVSNSRDRSSWLSLASRTAA